MIVCGWCESATEAEVCGHCGRDPSLPWVQRATEPPAATDHNSGGRPRLDAGQVRQRLRIAQKELGQDVTQAALAEHLEISLKTLRSWRKLAGL